MRSLKPTAADGVDAAPARAFARPARRSVADFAFTRSGGVFIGISVLLGVAAMAQQVNLLFLLFGLCMGALLVSGLLSGRPLRRVRIARIAPGPVLAGQAFEMRYIIRNTSRLGGAYSLHLREALPRDRTRGACETYIPYIGPRKSVEVSAPIICPSRGRLTLREVVVSTRFPFGLFRKTAGARIGGELIVYPAVGRLRVPIRDPRRLSAVSTTRTRQSLLDADEFQGLREFRRGDNPRWIHWRRSARMGRLLVREMGRVQRRHLIVVVDPRTASTVPADVVRREQAISAAATFCLIGLERGLAVGLVGLTAPPLIIPPVAGLEHRAKFLEELALLEPDPAADPAQLAQRMYWPSGWVGHCVLISAVDDEPAAQLVRIFARRCGGVERLSPGTEHFAQVLDLPREDAE